jgi:hypothetical protein
MMQPSTSLFKFIILLAIAVAILPSASIRAGVDEPVDTQPPEVNPLVLQIEEQAQDYYTDAFRNLDDADYLRAARLIEDLIRDFGDDPYVQDAYFYLADIYCARLQGELYYGEAIRVLEDFLRRHPSSDKCLDAELRIALINYRFLNNLDEALLTLRVYFAMLPLFQYLESEKLQGQLLMAKCYQKLGRFANEKSVWEGLRITSPEADRTGRYKFLTNINDWKRLTRENVILYFHLGITENDYSAALRDAENQLGALESRFGLKLPGPVEIYLYINPEDMAGYTSLEDPLPLDTDREIHLAVEQVDEMPYLVAYIYAGVLNSRPRAEKHPLMRGGFYMSFYKSPRGETIDELAARHLLLFDEAPGATLFLRESAFFGSAEYDRLSGSFCGYLLVNEPVEKFLDIYRGLYPTHDREMVEAAFERTYGKPMDELAGDWYASLGPMIAKARADVDATEYDLSPVDVDLSSPENALASWYEALRKGDFDALIKSSTPELKELFTDAKDAYTREGIFKEVIIEEFVYPYYPTTYRIVNEGPLGDKIYIFKIEIVKDDEVIEEKNVALRKISGKWYIDVNP